ncbi:MAG: DUF4968 domain-containing protein, partial [Bacteroidaceae bacterium]|nr:DUF4968 domain-containing protein [Bacteroidaceae bacterium]
MQRLLTLAALLLLSLCPTLAQEEINPIAHPDAIVQEGEMRFTVLTPQMIRIQHSARQQFEDRATFAIVNRRLPVPRFTTKREDGYLYIKTDKLTLRYKLGTVPDHTKQSADELRISFDLHGHTVIWYPGKGDALNLKGTMQTLNQLSGDNLRDEMERGILSRAGWSIIDESPHSHHVDGGQSYALQPNEDGIPWWSEPVDKEAQDWYFLGYGHDYRQALADYVKVAGRVPMPPRYALGYWYSRECDYTQHDVMQFVREAERHELPLDVILLDGGWHTQGWSGWSWHAQRFPHPEVMIDSLHQRGIRLSLNLRPAFGVESFEPTFQPLRQALKLGYDASAIPWHAEDYNFCKAFFSIVMLPLVKQKVDFWWNEWQQWKYNPRVPGMNESFWLNHITYYANVLGNRSSHRPLVCQQWGGMGSHRYGVGASGNVFSYWPTLAFLPYFTATASNVAYGYWGHAIGGRILTGDEEDPELMLRWLQYSVFSPLFRTNVPSTEHIKAAPWLYPNYSLLKQAVQ